MSRTSVGTVTSGAVIASATTNGLIGNDLDHESRLAAVEGAYVSKSAGAFTTSPTAPTPATSDSTTKVATTAHVHAVAGTISGSPDVRRIDVGTYSGVDLTGSADSSGGILTAVAAMTSGSQLYFRRGTYRWTSQTGAGSSGAAILLNGLSNISVYFEPGAELVMDNLSSGSGTTHGFAVYGACSNITFSNVRVRWATVPTTRSQGDTFRFLGYPSDSTPPGGWTTTTGTISNIRFVNCQALNAPQVGAIFMGCSDVQVENFYVNGTLADGLHFNACRRVNVNGLNAVSTGDDSLAFVTYYDPAALSSSSTGPFYQASLGDWSNGYSQATGIVVQGGSADGVRVSGAKDVSIQGFSIMNKPTGIILDSAITNGTTIAWTYLASLGIHIGNGVIEGCGNGIIAITQNITSASTATYYNFDATFSDLVIRGATARPISIGGNGSTTSIISGVNVEGVTITHAGSNPCRFSSMRNCLITGIFQTTTNGQGIEFYGQDSPLTGATSTLPDHNVVIDNIVCVGGRVFLQDMRTITIGTLRSMNAPNDGIQLVRVRSVTISLLDVRYHNRANSGYSPGIGMGPVNNVQITKAIVATDSNNSGTYYSLTIGNGGATEGAGYGLRIEQFVYTNALNQSGSDITNQGGTYAPTEFYFRASYYNGGESSPVWRTLHGGATPTMAERFIGSGTPAGNQIAGPGSTYQDTAGGGFWYKSSGSGTSGWSQLT